MFLKRFLNLTQIAYQVMYKNMEEKAQKSMYRHDELGYNKKVGLNFN